MSSNIFCNPTSNIQGIVSPPLSISFIHPIRSFTNYPKFACIDSAGDKTRMDQLSRSDECYVRASPTRGVLGGIAEHTADVITLCEAGNGFGKYSIKLD